MRRSIKATPPEVLVAGGIYCDLIFSGLGAMPGLGEEVRTQQFTMTVGGGAFITAAGLARLRVRTGLVAYVGADLLGRFQLQHLRRAGVDTSWVTRHAELGAGLSVAFSTATDRGFLTHPGCAAKTGELLDAWPWTGSKRIRHVHFAGMPEPFAARLPLLDRLRSEGITTSLDIGWNPAQYDSVEFCDVVRRVTIFMPSWSDARWFTGCEEPDAALEVLAGFVNVPVIKLGPEGAVGVHEGRPLRVSPPAVAAMETTGAGDAFDAGFLWAYLRGDAVDRCLLAGNICGALSTRAPGGTAAFPTLRELRAAMATRC
ncbi:MAG: carbohydrate kinase family protein [Armatimonadetes bacterium]|nr:carbohydrate kinase family protein [Armatimonadota bacterium]